MPTPESLPDVPGMTPLHERTVLVAVEEIKSLRSLAVAMMSQAHEGFARGDFKAFTDVFDRWLGSPLREPAGSPQNLQGRGESEDPFV